MGSKTDQRAQTKGAFCAFLGTPRSNPPAAARVLVLLAMESGAVSEQRIQLLKEGGLAGAEGDPKSMFICK